MGKAIIVPDADFSGLGMGKVHFSFDAPKVILGQSYTFNAGFTNPVWELDDDTYATIDSSTGVLTISSAAFGNDVMVTATKGAESKSAVVKLFYSATDSEVFEASKILDVSDNFRNGSVGNGSNLNRVAFKKTIAVDGYTKVMMVTTKEPETGYHLYTGMTLATNAGGTSTTNALTTICEYSSADPNLCPMGSILPLYEDPGSPYNYVKRTASGYTPKSFAMQIDESTDNSATHDRSLRVDDFVGETTKIALFK